MIRLALPYVYNLARHLEPIENLPTDRQIDLFDFMVPLWGAQAALELLLEGSVFSHQLRSSRPAGMQLLNLIRSQTANQDTARKPTLGDAYPIKAAFESFRTAFLAELGTFPTYFVSQKGSHDTLTLLDNPSLMFPADLGRKAPEALFDVAEAGKALCYEAATACGFHLFRATECVLRRYYSHVTGGRSQPKVRNIMVYVNSMRQSKCGDERILSVIEHMSKLHRNPIIHPEVALNTDEAISLLGMSHSVVTAMLAVLPVVPPTTVAAPLTA